MSLAGALSPSDDNLSVDLDWQPALNLTQEVVCWSCAAIACCVVYILTAPAGFSIPYATCIGLLFGMLLYSLRNSLMEEMYKVSWAAGALALHAVMVSTSLFSWRFNQKQKVQKFPKVRSAYASFSNLGKACPSWFCLGSCLCMVLGGDSWQFRCIQGSRQRTVVLRVCQSRIVGGNRLRGWRQSGHGLEHIWRLLLLA